MRVIRSNAQVDSISIFVADPDPSVTDSRSIHILNFTDHSQTMILNVDCCLFHGVQIWSKSGISIC